MNTVHWDTLLTRQHWELGKQENMLCKGTYVHAEVLSLRLLWTLFSCLTFSLPQCARHCFIELLSKIDRVISAVLREEEKIKGRREGFKTLTALCLWNEPHSKGKVGQQRFHYIECPLLTKVLISGNDPLSIFSGKKADRDDQIGSFGQTIWRHFIYLCFNNNSFNQCNMITTQALIHCLLPLFPELRAIGTQLYTGKHPSCQCAKARYISCEFITGTRRKTSNSLQTHTQTDNFQLSSPACSWREGELEQTKG